MPRWLGGRPAVIVERVLPPLGLVLRLVRLAMPPRYRGTETTPGAPWGLYQAGILAAGCGALAYYHLDARFVGKALEAASTHCTAWSAAVKPTAQPDIRGAERVLSVAWVAWTKALAATAGVLHWLAGHLGPLVPIVGAYFLLLGLAWIAHGVDRHRTREEWLQCRDLLHRVRYGQPWLDRGRHQAHLLANALVLICPLLVVAWAWWPFDPKLGALFRQSLVAGFVPVLIVQKLVTVGLVAAIALVVLWRTLQSMAGRRPFCDWPMPPAPDRDELAPAQLPTLTVDGRVGVPQMRPSSPLVAYPCNLDAVGRFGSASRRFAKLYAMGLATDCRYEPGGNLAGPSTWGPSVFGLVSGDDFDDTRAERGDFKRTTPVEIVTQLCRLMYMSAGVDGRIDRQANAVIRDFCQCHSLPRLVNDQDMATLLKALAAETWPRRTPLEAATAARQVIDGLEALPRVHEYISEWFEYAGARGVRHGSGTFDPLRNGSFQDAALTFSEMARLLVQAIVYADRRIDGSESVFIRELRLQGDVEAEGVVAAELPVIEPAVVAVAASGPVDGAAPPVAAPPADTSTGEGTP